ncbi:MAG TPA: hypothetical protein VHS78_18810 [Candidatus Elarobacter sp.]|nr:hypothetical protein [Candidatus Elarobacter sp.]
MMMEPSPPIRNGFGGDDGVVPTLPGCGEAVVHEHGTPPLFGVDVRFDDGVRLGVGFVVAVDFGAGVFAVRVGAEVGIAVGTDDGADVTTIERWLTLTIP